MGQKERGRLQTANDGIRQRYGMTFDPKTGVTFNPQTGENLSLPVQMYQNRDKAQVIDYAFQYPQTQEFAGEDKNSLSLRPTFNEIINGNGDAARGVNAHKVMNDLYGRGSETWTEKEKQLKNESFFELQAEMESIAHQYGLEYNRRTTGPAAGTGMNDKNAIELLRTRGASDDILAYVAENIRFRDASDRLGEAGESVGKNIVGAPVSFVETTQQQTENVAKSRENPEYAALELEEQQLLAALQYTPAMAGVGPMLGAGVMGLNAAGKKAQELAERGIGTREALPRSIGAGTIEAITEKMPLDSMAALLRGEGKSLIKNMLAQFGVEAGEEMLSYLGNYVADAAANDPNAKFSMLEMLEQGIGGGVSGLFFGAAGTLGGGLKSMAQNEFSNGASTSQGGLLLKTLDEYQQQIDDSFTGKMPSGQKIVMGDTPELLIQWGDAQPRSLTMTQNVARQIAYPTGYMGLKHGHNLGMSVLKSLRFEIENPVAILKNPQPNSSGADSIIVLTQWLDQKNNPVVVPVHLDSKGTLDIPENNIASTFGAEYIDKLIGHHEENVLYTKNNENIHQLLSNGSRIPEAMADDVFVYNNIAQKRKNGNPLKVEGRGTETQAVEVNAAEIGRDGTPEHGHENSGQDASSESADGTAGLNVDGKRGAGYHQSTGDGAESGGATADAGRGVAEHSASLREAAGGRADVNSSAGSTQPVYGSDSEGRNLTPEASKTLRNMPAAKRDDGTAHPSSVEGGKWGFKSYG